MSDFEGVARLGLVVLALEGLALALWFCFGLAVSALRRWVVERWRR